MQLNQVAAWRDLWSPGDYCVLENGQRVAVILVCPHCRGWLHIEAAGIAHLVPLTLNQQVVHRECRGRFDVKQGRMEL